MKKNKLASSFSVGSPYIPMWTHWEPRMRGAQAIPDTNLLNLWNLRNLRLTLFHDFEFSCFRDSNSSVISESLVSEANGW
jgi:hypothetical protein